MKASGWLQSAVTTSSSYVLSYVPIGHPPLHTSDCSSSSVLSLALSALCTYLTFGHHPHPYATLVPNFVSVTPSIGELASGEKLRTQSFTHPAYLIRREPKVSLRTTHTHTMSNSIVQ